MPLTLGDYHSYENDTGEQITAEMEAVWQHCMESHVNKTCQTYWTHAPWVILRNEFNRLNLSRWLATI
jgi:hypothetical protein